MASDPSALASAGDLEGHDLGDGRVSLRWTHPEDPAVTGVRFDVYGTLDPLDPFRVLRLSHADTDRVVLAGFDDGGDVHFSVVARRGTLTALPSRIVRVVVRPVHSPVALVPTAHATTPPRGLGFPFRVDGTGRIHSDSDDPLLRGKILQLLLTAPGERVNLPEYGTRLKDLVFDPNNDVLAAATEFATARALMRFLGEELQVDSVQIHSDGSELRVDIVYLRKSDLRTERLRIGVPIPR